MNSIRFIIGLIISGCILLAIRCTNPPLAGNSSQTPNAIVGVLYQPDGKTPAKGVRVHIRPKKSLADTSGAGMMKILAKLAATDSVVTDNAGQFAFDTTIDTGTYVITSASGNNAVLIDSVAVKNKAATDTLAPDTLKPAGAIKGVIKLSEGGDPRKVFVLAFGIDRFARVNADGSFKFSNLAKARYDLRLISSLDNYGVLDTFGIKVMSADTTDLDTIVLQFMGIPTPTGLKAVYETTTGKTFLSWNKLNYAIVGGYIVYRNDTSSTTPVNISGNTALKDTFFIDSVTIRPYDTNRYNFDYRLKAQDTSANLGAQYSQPVRVSFTIYPLWITVGDLSNTSAWGLNGFNIDGTGIPYIAYRDNYHSPNLTVMKYTGSTWSLVGQAGFTASNLSAVDIVFDINNTPYLTSRDNSSNAIVWKYSGTSWDTLGSLGYVQELSVPASIGKGDSLYVALVRNDNSVQVQKYNGLKWTIVGDSVFSHIPNGFRPHICLVVDDSSRPCIFAVDENNANKGTVKRYNGSTWDLVGSAGFTQSTGATAYRLAMAIDNSGLIYVAFNDNIQTEILKFNGANWESLGRQNFGGSATDAISLFFVGNILYLGVYYQLYFYNNSEWKPINKEFHPSKYATQNGIIYQAFRNEKSSYTPIKVMRYK